MAEKAQNIYELFNTNPEWAATGGLFGVENSSHDGFMAFTQYLKELKLSNGNTLPQSDTIVNPEKFLKFLSTEAGLEKYPGVAAKVAGMMKKGTMNNINFTAFSKAVDSNGFIDDTKHLENRFNKFLGDLRPSTGSTKTDGSKPQGSVSGGSSSKGQGHQKESTSKQSGNKGESTQNKVQSESDKSAGSGGGSGSTGSISSSSPDRSINQSTGHAFGLSADSNVAPSGKEDESEDKDDELKEPKAYSNLNLGGHRAPGKIKKTIEDSSNKVDTTKLKLSSKDSPMVGLIRSGITPAGMPAKKSRRIVSVPNLKSKGSRLNSEDLRMASKTKPKAKDSSGQAPESEGQEPQEQPSFNPGTQATNGQSTTRHRRKKGSSFAGKLAKGAIGIGTMTGSGIIAVASGSGEAAAKTFALINIFT